MPQVTVTRLLHFNAAHRVHNPALSDAENTRLFGHEVAPYLRDLWADQPDRWTPEITQKLVAANAPKMKGNGNTSDAAKGSFAAK